MAQKRSLCSPGKRSFWSTLASKVYATAPQPGTLDESIVYFVRDLGMRLPLAALLLNRLPAELQDRVRSVNYVEKTSIYGTASHHLAARTDTVDLQVWVADGDKPLPQRIVLTYKKAAGQPQFWAQFIDWNLAPQLNMRRSRYRSPMACKKSRSQHSFRVRRPPLPSRLRRREASDENRIVGPCHYGTWSPQY